MSHFVVRFSFAQGWKKTSLYGMMKSRTRKARIPNMLYYYHHNNSYFIAQKPLPAFLPCSEAEAAKAERLLYVSDRTGQGKTSWCINHPGYLADAPEGLWCLDTQQLDRLAQQPLPDWLRQRALQGTLMGTTAADAALAACQDAHSAAKKKVHILAMGDVGSTLLMGLSLLGGDCVAEIGIYDFNDKLCQRWEHEINQVAYPWAYDQLPQVRVLQQEALFDCDVFVFCASKAIPPVGAAVQDVRMAQLEANSTIIGQYGRMAREAHFNGLFAVVSDPVDPLCQRVWAASNVDAAGNWDGKGLRPEQVQGYGLGVMNSRAAYYAKQDARFQSFLTEGRAYGPHGQRLVIANSIAHYDNALSLKLTQKAVEANLEVRALGYKPYIAPALSSATISILLTLRGQWHYSSNFLGGIFMGCKNRSTIYGLELEHLPLPRQLLARLEAVVEELSALRV